MAAPAGAMTDHGPIRYRIIGMDCPDDVAMIEKAARKVTGVQDARVSLAAHAMTVRLADGPAPLSELEQAVTGLGFRLDRLDAPSAGDDELPAGLSHITPAYKRALWIVIILNVGYGLIEMVGGFLSGSQALKADALDFVGDSLISFLGLLAIGWLPIWRARAALIQGLVLGALGLGVLGTTAYRVLWRPWCRWLRESARPEAQVAMAAHSPSASLVPDAPFRGTSASVAPATSAVGP